ncbi:MAG: threonine ammonia-lyase [Thermoanaerobaculia bacterium]
MIEIADIQQARNRIAGSVKETPCLESEVLSELCGVQLYLKYESLQRTGSFKPRGAVNRLLCLSPAERERGVIAASAGNHAQGVAYAAATVGAQSLIVMPETTPLVKVTRTRELGARVELYGQSLDEALEHAYTLRDQQNLTFVHPFEDAEVIAGQGTVGLEILEQVPDLEAVVVPIGGGGLISGVATAVKALRPEVEVFGVQSRAAPAMKKSFDSGKWQEIGVEPTIAEGITLKRPGKNTFPIIQRLVDGIELVSEEEIEAAVVELLVVGKSLTEGAGAAGYCAVRQGRFPGLAGRRVVVVLCGANIDTNILGRIIERSLLKQHRLVRLRITIKDRPGGLSDLLDVVAEQGANVLHIHHDRVFTDTAFWQVEARLTLETRNREHIEELNAALRAAGYGRIEELSTRLVPGPREG